MIFMLLRIFGALMTSMNRMSLRSRRFRMNQAVAAAEVEAWKDAPCRQELGKQATPNQPVVMSRDLLVARGPTPSLRASQFLQLHRDALNLHHVQAAGRDRLAALSLARLIPQRQAQSRRHQILRPGNHLLPSVSKRVGGTPCRRERARHLLVEGHQVDTISIENCKNGRCANSSPK